MVTAYDTYAFPMGEDYNPAVFARNSGAHYTSLVDGQMHVVYVSYHRTTVSLPGSTVKVNNTIVYSAPNKGTLVPDTSSAIPIHKGDIIEITRGPAASSNLYCTALYVEDSSSIVRPSLYGMTLKTVKNSRTSQLTSVKPNTPLIVVFNTCRNHTPLTSSISFGAGEVSDIQTYETFGNFGAINYSRNLIVTGNARSATINITGTYDSSDSGYIASLSALYFTNS